MLEVLEIMFKVFSILTNIVTIAWIMQQSKDANDKNKNKED
ncbi:hypothetical protein [Niallia circulans]|nr:hypothetical protein [Niallia circulans]